MCACMRVCRCFEACACRGNVCNDVIRPEKRSDVAYTCGMDFLPCCLGGFASAADQAGDKISAKNPIAG